MGVAWLWLLDADELTVEVLENVGGRMVPRASFLSP